MSGCFSLSLSVSLFLLVVFVVYTRDTRETRSGFAYYIIYIIEKYSVWCVEAVISLNFFFPFCARARRRRRRRIIFGSILFILYI